MDLEVKLHQILDDAEQLHQATEQLLSKHQLPATVVPSVVTARRQAKAAIDHINAAIAIADQA